MDERTRSFLDLPRWVADRNDERAGFIHLAADGLWRANNWSGSLGAFTTADEAEAAIRAAPAKPKVKKAPEPSPPIRLRFESLTAIEAGYQVFARKRQIGAVIGLATANSRPGIAAGKLANLLRLARLRAPCARQTGPNSVGHERRSCRRSRLYRARLGAGPGSVPHKGSAPRGVAEHSGSTRRLPQTSSTAVCRISASFLAQCQAACTTSGRARFTNFCGNCSTGKCPMPSWIGLSAMLGFLPEAMRTIGGCEIPPPILTWTFRKNPLKADPPLEPDI